MLISGPSIGNSSSDPYWDSTVLLIRPTSLILEDLSPMSLDLTPIGVEGNITRIVEDSFCTTRYSLRFPSQVDSRVGHVNCGAGPQSVLEGDFTIEFAIRGDGGVGRAILGTYGWGIILSDGFSGPGFGFSNVGEYERYSYNWYYLILMRANDKFMVWLNGKLITIGSNSETIGSSQDDLWIGRAHGGDFFGKGDFGLIRITKAA